MQCIFDYMYFYQINSQEIIFTDSFEIVFVIKEEQYFKVEGNKIIYFCVETILEFYKSFNLDFVLFSLWDTKR